MNRTFTMIKPDAVGNNYIGLILAKINEAGFRIVAMKGDVRKLRSLFKGRNPSPVTIEEMNETIAKMGARSA